MAGAEMRPTFGKTAESPVAIAAVAQICHFGAASPMLVDAQGRANAVTRRPIERIQPHVLEARIANTLN